jgi:hypothetical protein
VIRRAAAAAGLALLACAACTHDLHADLPRRSANYLPSSITPPLSIATETVVSAPQSPAPAARLDLVSGFTAISVRVANLNGALFRASMPTASGAAPVADVQGNTVRLTQRSLGTGNGQAVVTVDLTPDRSWTIAVDGGATVADLDLSGGRIDGVDLASGISSVTLTLPSPHGTTRMVMSGGATQLRIHLTGPAPVRASLAGGVADVTIDGQERTGVAGGTVLASPGWTTAANRYDLTCSAGVSDLTVDRTA